MARCTSDCDVRQLTTLTGIARLSRQVVPLKNASPGGVDGRDHGVGAGVVIRLPRVAHLVRAFDQVMAACHRFPAPFGTSESGSRGGSCEAGTSGALGSSLPFRREVWLAPFWRLILQLFSLNSCPYFARPAQAFTHFAIFLGIFSHLGARDRGFPDGPFRASPNCLALPEGIGSPVYCSFIRQWTAPPQF